MSLSKAIQQKEFRNEYQQALLNILYTHSHFVNLLNEVFKPFDITRQQYNVLRILRGQHPGHASVNDIKDRMLDKMSDTSRMVERLRAKGLLSRCEAQHDKRAVEITITKEGLDLLEKMQVPVDNFEKHFHKLTPEETRQLNYLLDKLRGDQTEFSNQQNEDFELISQPEKF